MSQARLEELQTEHGRVKSENQRLQARLAELERGHSVLNEKVAKIVEIVAEYVPKEVMALILDDLSASTPK